MLGVLIIDIPVVEHFIYIYIYTLGAPHNETVFDCYYMYIYLRCKNKLNKSDRGNFSASTPNGEGTRTYRICYNLQHSYSKSRRNTTDDFRHTPKLYNRLINQSENYPGINRFSSFKH